MAYENSGENNPAATIEKGSPIKSGWKGCLNGYVERTEESSVNVSRVSIDLDNPTAYALCNMLTDSVMEKSFALEKDQFEAMSNLGAAIGRLIDHHSANNGGRCLIKS